VLDNVSSEEKQAAATNIPMPTSAHATASTHIDQPSVVELRHTTKPRAERFRLVGPDNILVKSVTFHTAKNKTPIITWPIVVPDSMVPAVMGLFHGDKSPIGHGGKHKTYGALRKRFAWKGMVKSIRHWVGACHNV
jgi:hypothetical protein